jgi:hypothetical protein
MAAPLERVWSALAAEPAATSFSSDAEAEDRESAYSAICMQLSALEAEFAAQQQRQRMETDDTAPSKAQKSSEAQTGFALLMAVPDDDEDEAEIVDSGALRRKRVRASQPSWWLHFISSCFRDGLDAFARLQGRRNEEEEEGEEDAEAVAAEAEAAKARWRSFQRTCTCLRNLHVLHLLTDHLISALRHGCFLETKRLMALADGEYEVPWLKPLRAQWAARVALPFAAHTLLGDDLLHKLAVATSSTAAQQVDMQGLQDVARAAGFLPPKPAARAASQQQEQQEQQPTMHRHAVVSFSPFGSIDDGSGLDIDRWSQSQSRGGAKTRLSGAGAGAEADAAGLLRALLDCEAAISIATYEYVASARIDEMFALVRDFPDSQPALFELRESLLALDGDRADSARARIVTVLVEALRTRLLHPGVATSSILDVFLSSVRAVRIVDTTGVLLALTADPIQSYLRTRHDTIRCIVTSLTEDTDSELYAELVRKDGKLIEKGRKGDDSDDEGAGGASASAAAAPSASEPLSVLMVRSNDNSNSSSDDAADMSDAEPQDDKKPSLSDVCSLFSRRDRTVLSAASPSASSSSAGSVAAAANPFAPLQVPRAKHLWSPPPADVDLTREGSRGNFGDLLALLVNIYGSKEMFVAEYRSMLSERLLAREIGSWEMDTEERVVELLKLRFGEDAMTSAEIMLRDVLDSKRVSTAVAEKHRRAIAAAAASNGSAAEDEAKVESIIISHKYWPVLSRDKVELAQPLVELFERIASGYAELKKPRKLNLLKPIGIVEVEITLPNDETGEEEVKTVAGTPPQVSLLLHMDGKRSILLSELAKACQTTGATTLRLASHWVAKGILVVEKGATEESTTIWVAGCVPQSSSASAQRGAASSGAVEDDGSGGAGAGGGSSDPPEALMCWESYVRGELSDTLLPPLSLIITHLCLSLLLLRSYRRLQECWRTSVRCLSIAYTTHCACSRP